MATIRKRPTGSWEVQIRRRGYRTVARTFDKEGDAKKWAKQFETAIAAGRFVPADPAHLTTLKQALDRYEEERKSKKGYQQERHRINMFRAVPWADLPLASVRSAHIAEWVGQRRNAGTADGTILNDLKVLSTLFNTARRDWGLEDLKNPVAVIRKPKAPRGRERRLQPGEEERLLAACRLGIRPLIELAIETAMRRGELLGLRWENIDLARRVAHLPETKTDIPRDVPLSAGAVEVLRKLPRRLDGKVFEYDGHYVSNTFRLACSEARIAGLHFHDLRHEATSRLFEMGLGIEEVALITGHVTWTMLRRYTHLKPDDIVKRLDQLANARAAG